VQCNSLDWFDVEGWAVTPPAPIATTTLDDESPRIPRRVVGRSRSIVGMR
jgi:hypothetical protein